MPDPGDGAETLTHRLVLPRDTNHYGTLYAGAILALALEAAYAVAFRATGPRANLVLKRVLDLRCHEPVPVGTFVTVRGREVHRARAQIVVALHGAPLAEGRENPWLDGVFQFVQVDDAGRPEPLAGEPVEPAPGLPPPWEALRARALRLMAVRG
jgi:acyl-CoA hydrolase